MNARSWHQLLTNPGSAAPAPLSWAQVQRLSAHERALYARRVADWFGQVWFDSPLVDAVIGQIGRRIEANQRSPVGPKEIVAIDGPYGVGKTSTILKLARALYPDYVTEPNSDSMPTWAPEAGIVHDLVPVMWVQLQAGSSLKTLYGSLLDFVRYPLPGTSGVLASRALRALDAFGVRVMILDDVHKLRESQQASRDIIDALHTINTRLGEQGGTLCLVGSEMEKRTLLNHPQIDSRLKTYHLTPFSIDTHPAQVTWQRFLRGIENVCAPYLAGNRPGFLANELPAHIHARTQGFMQDIQQLLKDAVHLALASAELVVTADTIDQIRLSERAQRAESLLHSAQLRTRGSA